ncbi:uncharacterized protein MONBRDRAFT_29337 [Monosiga brevicollis MX1]|uniref:Endonuclease/exonuclease/phosphatase domain-containing protein n=1 Tax=Monosiga brevicollis TaxID=81824 RepID=A9VAT5_MONBE|nr:uncharacterized protein MONBRDRAFT_29337 [Monosiga brevicollis MX1]EDQ85431.1 predicted protein [Monosiga brevicollis MX1]|eukprot:XP_001749842.1 hypothetical protein [Monosiga brevicollis MX1]
MATLNECEEALRAHLEQFEDVSAATVQTPNRELARLCARAAAASLDQPHARDGHSLAAIAWAGAVEFFGEPATGQLLKAKAYGRLRRHRAARDLYRDVADAVQVAQHVTATSATDLFDEREQNTGLTQPQELVLGTPERAQDRRSFAHRQAAAHDRSLQESVTAATNRQDNFNAIYTHLDESPVKHIRLFGAKSVANLPDQGQCTLATLASSPTTPLTAARQRIVQSLWTAVQPASEAATAEDVEQLLSPFKTATQITNSTHLSLVSWNVKLANLTDQRADSLRTSIDSKAAVAAKLVADVGADVLVLQECPGRYYQQRQASRLHREAYKHDWMGGAVIRALHNQDGFPLPRHYDVASIDVHKLLQDGATIQDLGERHLFAWNTARFRLLEDGPALLGDSSLVDESSANTSPEPDQGRRQAASGQVTPVLKDEPTEEDYKPAELGERGSVSDVVGSKPVLDSAFYRPPSYVVLEEHRKPSADGTEGPGLVLVVVSCHLKAGGGELTMDETRRTARQCQTLFQRLSLAHPDRALAVVTCGDFNLDPKQVALIFQEEQGILASKIEFLSLSDDQVSLPPPTNQWQFCAHGRVEDGSAYDGALLATTEHAQVPASACRPVALTEFVGPVAEEMQRVGQAVAKAVAQILDGSAVTAISRQALAAFLPSAAAVDGVPSVVRQAYQKEVGRNFSDHQPLLVKLRLDHELKESDPNVSF